MFTESSRDGRHNRLYLEEYVGAGLLAIMTIILFVQVFFRFALQNSLSWSEELARYIFIWLNFWMLGVVTLRGEHIAIDMLTSKFSGYTRKIAVQIVIGICIILNLVLIYFGLELAIVQRELGQTSAALQIPKWIVYSALPVGLIIATIRSIQTSIQEWKGTSVLWRSSSEDETEGNEK